MAVPRPGLGLCGTRPPGVSIKRAYDWAGISDEPEPDIFRASSPWYRCEDMDRDGIGAQLIYEPIAPLGRISDPALQAACCAAYNSWLKEVKDESDERMLGLAVLPLLDPEAATNVLHQVAKLGLKCISFDGFSAPKPIWEEVWEPLRAAAAESGLPVSVHVGVGVRTAQAGNPHRGQSLIFAAALPVQLDEVFAGIIFSGILDRHPNIRFVLAETGIGWIAYYLHRMDRECRGPFPTDITLSAPPSELFRRQMYVTFQEEEEGGLRRIPEIGVDNVNVGVRLPPPRQHLAAFAGAD
jgi:predicted TIM-barrel fold metal-dependent hydrolase